MRELFGMLSPRRRRQFYLLVALMIAGAFAELATIGAVLPFLSLLADPRRIERLPALVAAFDAVGATTDHQRLIAATILFVLLAVVSAAVRLQLAWSSNNFVFRLGHDFDLSILRRLLLQPYSFHINQNTSSLVAALEKVGVLVFNVLQQVMQAGISIFISLFIIAALILVDPFTALAAAAAFTAIYLLVSAATRRRLARNSAVIGASWDQRVKIVQESLGGIRDVIIDNSQAVYVDSFERIDNRFTRAKANTAFIGAAPRFVIEALGMVLIALLAIVISGRHGGFAGALPILGALALGAQRLLPLLQQVYVGWSLAAGHSSVLNQVLDLLRLPVDEALAEAPAAEPLPLNDRIRVEKVSFAYDGRRAPALEDISFEIPRGQRVALIGKTGSGKSTLADLLMGLLDPGAGRISVDGVPIDHRNRLNWQRSIAHVPQAIFLADASIAHNIAFGVSADAIDLERVIEAAKKAQLDEFVDELPEGYDTHVGERGVRLSGGQRQRLGIARAIYKQAPVLVLDEATSALDDATEAAVMHALDRLGEEGRTIIMIAHRLSSISRADMVVRLDNGRLAEVGSYADVVGPTPQARVF
jgi:ATP-binding cassette subfamily B protein